MPPSLELDLSHYNQIIIKTMHSDQMDSQSSFFYTRLFLFLKAVFYVVKKYNAWDTCQNYW